MQVKLPDPIPISDIKLTSYTVLVYGRSGTGKTEFAGTWPKPILFIDTDNGITTIKASPRIKDKDQIFVVPIADKPPSTTVNQPLGFLTVKAIVDDIANTGKYGEIEPKTLVLDTLSTTARYCMTHVLHINRHTGQQPTLPDWGRQMREIIDLLMIGVGLECNFLVLAHEQYMKDELSGRVWCLPLITGKLAYELGDCFDEVYHATVREQGGKHLYMLDTKATGLITAKTRLDVPSQITTHFDSIKGTIEKLKGEK